MQRQPTVLPSDFSLHLPGLSYHVSTPKTIPPLYSFLEEHYQAFRTTAHATVQQKWAVFITEEPASHQSSRQLLFDAAPAWQLHALENGNRLFSKSIPAGPMWTAELDHRKAQIIIHLQSASTYQDGYIHPFQYPLDQLISMTLLPTVDALLLHAVGIVFKKTAWVFPGVSGAGKSTLSKLVREYIPGATVLSDDRIMLIRHQGQWLASGTPWPGEGQFSENITAPLHMIGMLQQDSSPALNLLSKDKALKCLLPTTSIQWFDHPHVDACLNLCNGLLNDVGVNQFQFTREKDTADYLTSELNRV